MIPSDNLLKSAIAWKELLKSEQTKAKAREIARNSWNICLL